MFIACYKLSEIHWMGSDWVTGSVIRTNRQTLLANHNWLINLKHRYYS